MWVDCMDAPLGLYIVMGVVAVHLCSTGKSVVQKLDVHPVSAIMVCGVVCGVLLAGGPDDVDGNLTCIVSLLLPHAILSGFPRHYFSSTAAAASGLVGITGGLRCVRALKRLVSPFMRLCMVASS
jgi:hypothetical protein